jgi:hypothetical protein
MGLWVSVKCRLLHVKFAEKPKYEAISYTWGGESYRRELTIDGMACSVGLDLVDACARSREIKSTDS